MTPYYQDDLVTILEALTHSPTTKKALAEKLGTDTRTVELMIQEARLNGAPICSSSDGYWLGTADEVEACSRRLRSRFIHQAITARALRRTARRMRGVEQVAFDWERAA